MQKKKTHKVPPELETPFHKECIVSEEPDKFVALTKNTTQNITQQQV
mgnify:CR=1 FL=1